MTALPVLLITGSLLLSPQPLGRDDAEGKQRASRSSVISNVNQLPKVWQRIVACESSGRANAVSPSGKHYGYFQIHKGWFKGVGLDYQTATLYQQYKLALAIYKKQGAKAWSCAKKAGLK